MEAAPRPLPELLVDLPIEEPLNALAPPKGEPPTLAPAPPVPAPASAARPAKDPEQTDLHFMDPELFLPPDEPSGALPFAPQAAAPVEHPGAELELQDPIVDELLTSPPPPPAPAPPAAAAPPVILTPTSPAAAAQPEAGSARGAPRAAPNDAQARASTRVPLAQTAALTAAAAQLAGPGAARPRATRCPARWGRRGVCAHGAGLHRPQSGGRALSVGTAAAQGRDRFRAFLSPASRAPGRDRSHRESARRGAAARGEWQARAVAGGRAAAVAEAAGDPRARRRGAGARGGARRRRPRPRRQESAEHRFAE